MKLALYFLLSLAVIVAGSLALERACRVSRSDDENLR